MFVSKSSQTTIAQFLLQLATHSTQHNHHTCDNDSINQPASSNSIINTEANDNEFHFDDKCELCDILTRQIDMLTNLLKPKVNHDKMFGSLKVFERIIEVNGEWAKQQELLWLQIVRQYKLVEAVCTLILETGSRQTQTLVSSLLMMTSVMYRRGLATEELQQVEELPAILLERGYISASVVLAAGLIRR